MNSPNLKTVELCLTYRCNVKCNNCSNLCTQAPFTGDLTPEAVYSFLNDSVLYDHKWNLITLHGGEPVLTPNLDTICQYLFSYRKQYNPDVKIWILTNNSTDKIRERVMAIAELYQLAIGISTKRGKNIGPGNNPIYYVPVNKSPIDDGCEYNEGCYQSFECGVCYNYLGYFECSPAAAAARVFGYKPIATSISGLTEEIIRQAYKDHCKHCGFALKCVEKSFEQVTSKTWKDAFDSYNEKMEDHDE